MIKTNKICLDCLVLLFVLMVGFVFSLYFGSLFWASVFGISASLTGLGIIDNSDNSDNEELDDTMEEEK